MIINLCLKKGSGVLTTSQPLQGESLAFWQRRQNLFDASFRDALMIKVPFHPATHFHPEPTAAAYCLVSSKQVELDPAYFSKIYLFFFLKNTLNNDSSIFAK